MKHQTINTTAARLLVLVAVAAFARQTAITGEFDPVVLGRWDGGGSTVKVSGDFAYVADGTNLHVINVANPANPVGVAKYSTRHEDAEINDLALAGNHAYLVTDEWRDEESGEYVGGFEVVDVSNPAQPTRVGQLDSGASGAIAVAGSYAYAARVGVINVSQPTAPSHVGDWRLWDSGSMVVSGQLLLVVDGELEEELHFINIAVPDLPWQLVEYKPLPKLGVEIPWRDSWVRAVTAASGSLAFLIVRYDGQTTGEYDYEGLEVLDIAFPGDPQLLGRYLTFAGINSVAAVRPYAYLGTDAGVLVIDVSVPTNPQRVGANHQFPVDDIAVADGKLYALGEHGLFILQAPSAPGPARPQFAAPIQMTRNGAKLALSGPAGKTAYVQRTSNLAQWEDWLSVTLPDKPVEVTDEEAVVSGQRFYRLMLK